MDHQFIVRTEDGSVETIAREVIYFSIERFKRGICEGGCCFLCGCQRENNHFNDEHVLPVWLLAKCNLFDKTINLPNGTSFRYSRYKISCCSSCNTRLGKEIEVPVSQLLKSGYEAVVGHIQSNGTQLLYTWLSLVFLKTHLRDQFFRYYLDTRKGNDLLSRNYDWADFHHTHAVARAFFSGCSVEQKARGSFCVFQATTAPHYEHFDYHDLFLAQSVLLRVGDVALLAVFDDGFGALSYRQQFLSRIDGAVSPVQLREVLAHLAYTNLKLAERPGFYTDFLSRPCVIRADLPKYANITKHEPRTFGRIFHACVGHFLDHMSNSNISEIRANIKAGTYTFLYDADGQFIQNSLEPAP